MKAGTVRIRFLTSTPLDIERGSGTYVGIHGLAKALERLGHAVEFSTPRVRLPVYTCERLWFNRWLSPSQLRVCYMRPAVEPAKHERRRCEITWPSASALGGYEYHPESRRDGTISHLVSPLRGSVVFPLDRGLTPTAKTNAAGSPPSSAKPALDGTLALRLRF